LKALQSGREFIASRNFNAAGVVMARDPGAHFRGLGSQELDLTEQIVHVMDVVHAAYWLSRADSTPPDWETRRDAAQFHTGDYRGFPRDNPIELAGCCTHCAVSWNAEIVPVSKVEIGGPCVPVPTNTVENVPVMVIDFPLITPLVMLTVTGLEPPLERLAEIVSFAPLSEPVAVFVNELGLHDVFDGQDTTLILTLTATFPNPVIDPSLFWTTFSVNCNRAEAE
jgi:hypothetical protein